MIPQRNMMNVRNTKTKWNTVLFSERMCVFTEEWEVIPYDKRFRETLSGKDFVTSCCGVNGMLLVLFSSADLSGPSYQALFNPTSCKWAYLEEISFSECHGKEKKKPVIMSKLFSGHQLTWPSRVLTDPFKIVDLIA